MRCIAAPVFDLAGEAADEDLGLRALVADGRRAMTMKRDRRRARAVLWHGEAGRGQMIRVIRVGEILKKSLICRVFLHETSPDRGRTIHEAELT